jgi:predicted XRE-type DNA-binding protein
VIIVVFFLFVIIVVFLKKQTGVVMSKACENTGDMFSPLMDSKQIKETIKALGWNQKEIAAYWGVSQNWISTLVKNANGQRSARDDCAFRGLPKKV